MTDINQTLYRYRTIGHTGVGRVSILVTVVNLTRFQTDRMRRAIISTLGGPLKVVEGAVPEVPAEGAVVKTSYAGVCHSDLHFIEDEAVIRDGEVFRLRELIGDGFYNITPGHEICGVVIAIGPNADLSSNDVKVGDNVCVYPWIGCQKCETCILGLNNICEKNIGGSTDLGQNMAGNGGFSTHLAVPQCCFLIKVPDTIPMSVACMLPCSASTAYTSLLRATPHLQQGLKARGNASLLIIGAGGVGLWSIQLAKKALFADQNIRVIVADISEEKIQTAMAAGADEGFVWGRDEKIEDLVAKTTDFGGKKATAAINYYGSPKNCEVAMQCLHRAGVLVVIGLACGAFPLSLCNLVSGSISVLGSRTSSQEEMRDLVEIVSKKGLQFPNLEEFKLDEVNAALEKLKAGKITGRGIIKYD